MRETELSRTYVDHLRAEHRQLHAGVRKVQNILLSGTFKRGQTDELLRQCSALDMELRRHFAKEEQGGCLEEAVSLCPHVAFQADTLQREHAGLLARLEHLISRLRERTGEPIVNVQAEFTQLTQDLLAHEAAENRLMERAFGVALDELD